MITLPETQSNRKLGIDNSRLPRGGRLHQSDTLCVPDGAASPARSAYIFAPVSRTASIVSQYGVSHTSVQPTCMFSPSKRPEVAWSEN